MEFEMTEMLTIVKCKSELNNLMYIISDVEIVNIQNKDYVQYMRKEMKEEIKKESEKMKNKGLHKYDIQEIIGKALIEICKEKKIFIDHNDVNTTCYIVFKKEKIIFNSNDIQKNELSIKLNNFCNVDKYIKMRTFEGGNVEDFL
jgi:hypothetical protein